MKFHLKTLVAAAGLALLPAAQANLLFGISGGNVSVTVVSDISFTATGATPDNFLRFVFDDAYLAAPNPPTSFGTVSNTITVERNGVPLALGTNSAWGPLAFSLGEVDGNDFIMSFTGTSGIQIGDIVTLRPGTAVTNVAAALLPNVQPLLAVMVDNSGNALSAAVTLVPEPGTVALALLGLGVVGAAVARRRA